MEPKSKLPEDNGDYKNSKYDQSLFKALFKTFFFQIWSAGILKLMAGKFEKLIIFLILLIKLKIQLDTLNTTTPLLTKVLLTWLTHSFVYSRLTIAERAAAAAQGFLKPQGLGHGIGLGFAIFIMQGEKFKLDIIGTDRFSNINVYVETASLVSDTLHIIYHYSMKNP